ncbi:uncharacterized protein LOC132737457 [Ruditapes philippinarum]|uniref:uncharacterized protein LOC132737457 n=1 Tax=Ruditapes philippinarum TaxID=129788 RepID=UPI00295B6CBF|nr:uncharacterized protein LOC132737457 [Ruditapes philippinarum]XP_060580731.1 uncharacterized protein LOC132737457 [Ruditapes philippinarum]
MAGKRHCSLFCSPQPIARLVQIFPKLAIIFFVIHFTVIIYSFLSPSPHAMKSNDVPPGVVDDKMQSVGNHIRINANINASDNNILHQRHNDVSSSNKTKSLLLQKLIPNGIHGNKGRKDSNIEVNVHKRSIER